MGTYLITIFYGIPLGLAGNAFCCSTAVALIEAVGTELTFTSLAAHFLAAIKARCRVATSAAPHVLTAVTVYRIAL